MDLSADFERLFAGRWIAGYYPEDAIKKAKMFNSLGISGLVNFLGEELRDEHDINDAVKEYIGMIEKIKSYHIDAAISIKPTQLGLLISYKVMLSNYLKIVASAKENGVFVWLDMETPEHIDDVIKAYLQAVNHGNTGICIQAYLRRSEHDVRALTNKGGVIRLVKGAYQIKSNDAFHSKREVNHSYVSLMKMLFVRSDDFMLATHDSRIIEEAVRLNMIYKRHVTYAMLNGIRNRYALHLKKNGHKVAIYIPFGRDWIGFGYRRLVEQRHMSIIIRSLFQRQDIWQN